MITDDSTDKDVINEHSEIAEKVRAAAMMLIEQGKAPTVTGIRGVLGTGSFTTIGKHFSTFLREAYVLLTPSTQIPDPVVAAMKDLWLLSLKESATRFDAEKTHLQEQVAAFEVQMQMMTNQATELKQERDSVTSELELTAKSLDSLAAKHDAEVVKRTALEEEKKELIAFAQHQSDKLNAEQEAHEKTHDDLNAEIEAKDNQHLIALAAEKERSTLAENTLMQRISDLQVQKDKEITNHKKVIEALQAENAGLAKRYEDSYKAKDFIRTRLEETKAEQANQAAIQAKALSEANRMIEKLQTQVKGMETAETQLRVSLLNQETMNKLILESIIPQLESKFADKPKH